MSWCHVYTQENGCTHTISAAVVVRTPGLKRRSGKREQIHPLRTDFVAMAVENSAGSPQSSNSGQSRIV